MTREQAIELIRTSAVSEHTDTLVGYLNPSARMIVHDELRAHNGVSIQSHFGGLPSLPQGTEWPTWEKSEFLKVEIASLEKQIEKAVKRTQETPEEARERREKILAALHPKLAEGTETQRPEADPETSRRIAERLLAAKRERLAKMQDELQSGPTPLAFLGQISLREAFSVAPLPGLPYEGALAFFYDATAQVWGFSPDHRGHCRVLYFPEAVPLATAQFPDKLSTKAHFHERALSLECEWTLPTYLELEQDGGRLALWRTDEYKKLIEKLNSDNPDLQAPVHRLGGYPQEIQNDMRLECQLVTNGLYCGNSSGYKDARAAELAPGALDWRLLAQFDSDEKNLGWMWGDVGRVYFWARWQDIEAANFASSWAILQCY